MSYQIEFPDFPVSDIPAIPVGWKDSSWHNDVCPSFTIWQATAGDSNYQYARVWIAESDPALREFPESARFQISFESGETDFLCALATDDWQEVLDYIAARYAVAARYLESVGYNPFLDDPALNPLEVTL